MATNMQQVDAGKLFGGNQGTDRSLRSVFVGNIPYEATEEQLKDIFSEVGPVVSFRLVYDRETGKPKGYGFCEYKDQETALSAMRNLSGYELNGRQLRVDNAASEKNKEELKNLHAAGPPQESPFGEAVPPTEAPEAISKAVASLPPEQMFELMKQMKLVIQNNPVEARNMLLQNPQLAYALLQAQVVMRIVSPEIAMAMLHKPQNPPQPLVPPGSIAAVQGGQPQGQNPMSLMTNPNMGGPLQNQGGPVTTTSQQPMPQVQMQAMQTLQSQSVMGQGQMSQGQMGQGQMVQGQPSQGPLGQGGPMNQGIRMEHHMEPRMLGPGQGQPQGQQPMSMQGMQGHPGHGSMQQGPPRTNRPGLLGDAPMEPRGPQDPRARQDPRSMDPRGGGPGPRGPAPQQQQQQQQPQRGGIPQGAAGLGGPLPHNLAGLTGATAPSASPGQQITPQDQEKAALIMQVLQLTPEQVAMLPPDQRQSIMILKEQIARSSGP